MTRTSDAFDGPMVLRHKVVQVLDLPHDDHCLTSAIDLINGRLVGAAFVHRDFFGCAVGLHGFFEEQQGCGLAASGRQQEVDRLSLVVHRAVQVFLDTFNLDTGLVHPPAAAHRALVFAEHFLKQGLQTGLPSD